MSMKSKSSIWWKGALKGALGGVPIGIALGVGGVLLMWGIATAFPAIGLAGIFNNFLFQTAGGAITGVNFLPFTLLNTTLSVISGLFSGGSQAICEHEQAKVHRCDLNKVAELDARTKTLEIALTKPSRQVQAILDRGPRNTTSFTDAEQTRGNLTKTTQASL